MGRWGVCGRGRSWMRHLQAHCNREAEGATAAGNVALPQALKTAEDAMQQQVRTVSASVEVMANAAAAMESAADEASAMARSPA